RVEPIRPGRLEVPARAVRRHAAWALGLALAARRLTLARHLSGPCLGVLRHGAGVEPAAAVLYDHRFVSVLESLARPLHGATPAVLVDVAPRDAAVGELASGRHHRTGVARRRDRLGMAQSLVVGHVFNVPVLCGASWKLAPQKLEPAA